LNLAVARAAVMETIFCTCPPNHVSVSGVDGAASSTLISSDCVYAATAPWTWAARNRAVACMSAENFASNGRTRFRVYLEKPFPSTRMTAWEPRGRWVRWACSARLKWAAAASPATYVVVGTHVCGHLPSPVP
jgi:hypothetical protein